MIDDSLGMGGRVWWGSVVVRNLPSERKLPMGKVQKKVKKTNNSAFSATHTSIKLTLVSFFTFFYAPSPKHQTLFCNDMKCEIDFGNDTRLQKRIMTC